MGPGEATALSADSFLVLKWLMLDKVPKKIKSFIMLIVRNNENCVIRISKYEFECAPIATHLYKFWKFYDIVKSMSSTILLLFISIGLCVFIYIKVKCKKVAVAYYDISSTWTV